MDVHAVLTSWKVVFIILILVSLGVRQSSCCAPITHIEIAERTREHFGIVSEGVNYHELLTRHEDAFQAGAPYPDAYYPGFCAGGEYHAVSEDSHWTPFINATVTYIRDTYSRPWNRTGEKLVTFLLSVVTHQVADVNWHSLDLQQGFLTTMGMINYHGSYSAAHTDGDFGGDVLNLFGLDMSYIGKLTKWYVPVEDLLGIYRILYDGEERITREVIENCTTLLFLGRLGENIGVVDKLYPFYAQRSPFLTDRLQDYFLGGMDDMSVWSQTVWRHTVDMLDYGTGVCDLQHNPVFITCNTLRLLKRSLRQLKATLHDHPGHVASRHHVTLKDAVELPPRLKRKLIAENIKIKYTERGMKLIANKSLKKELKRVLENRHTELHNDDLLNYSDASLLEDDLHNAETYYATLESYSRLGECMVSGDLNNDGFDDLIVSAPGYSSDNNIQRGRVYIIYGSEAGLPSFNFTIEDEADLIINGSNSKPNGRFGHALAVLDLDQNGCQDLVVSAPAEGSPFLEYTGAMYVFFSTRNEDECALQTTAGLTQTCTQTYCNMGWSLATGDVNNDGYDDLIVGSPFAPMGGEQRGLVGVLLANTSLADVGSLTEENFDWQASGKQDYEWFGYSVAAAVPADDVTSWLIVGAPTYRICASPDCNSYDDADIQSVGRVDGYKSPLDTSEPSFSVSGTQEFQQLGFSVNSGQFGDRDYLFVTSGTADSEDGSANLTQSGKVDLLAWSDLIEGNTTVTSSINGDRSYARFGSSVQLLDCDGDGDDDLLITASLRSGSYREYQEAGRAFVFHADDVMPGFNSYEQAFAVLGADRARLRFGYSSAVIRSNATSVSAVFGMPHLSDGARLGGGVAVFPLPLQ